MTFLGLPHTYAMAKSGLLVKQKTTKLYKPLTATPTGVSVLSYCLAKSYIFTELKASSTLN